MLQTNSSVSGEVVENKQHRLDFIINWFLVLDLLNTAEKPDIRDMLGKNE